MHDLVVQQGQRAIAGADLLVFLVDGREGLASGDETIAQELRQTGLPVILAVNKADDKRTTQGAMEFYQLGFEPLTEISAEHGTGVGDLLDEIVKRVGIREQGLGIGAQGPEGMDRESGTARPKVPVETNVAIVGRPNVGKSSLLNRLLKEERVLVSEMPGTTRDAIDAVLTWHTPPVPHRRYRRDAAPRTRPQRRAGGAGERRGREEGDLRR